ncbi:CUB and zona pellucida-like domain-containing protein 1 [Pagrus major]|uniref:CUB and zona pellucida-like domain-containing protein 1 n=1 Tax=Pagrus major TaxID=143350 RepID=UPI003CC83EBA
MASLTLLLHLLLMVSAASAWSRSRTRTDPNMKRFFGGSLTVAAKGRNSDGTYETSSSVTRIAVNSYSFRWCQHEVVTKRKLPSNLPFLIRYPSRVTSTTGEGYWVANARTSAGIWRMMASIDLGTRSDTGKSNRPPVTTMLPILRTDATVTCNETTMKVEVEKTYLIRRFEDDLHLNDFRDSSCNLTTRSNSTHLVAFMSLNTCGTLIEEDDNNIIFKNEITSADTNGVISRQHDVEIAFSCVYPKRTNLTLGFTHKNPYAFTEKGFGAFTFQFEFFESERFRRQVSSSTYPVEVYLKQMMFMQIEATTSIPNTELFVESCRATPFDNPNSRISYTIIQNGCVKDNTVQIYPSSSAQFRFGMEAFEFIGAHEQVYITCSVILCESGVSGTRCSQGCVRSTSGNSRRKREAVAETSSHSISQGPLHLVKTSDSQGQRPSLNLGMNIVFVVGCLLACGVVIYRSRRSNAKYQPLPTSDMD